MQPTTTCNIARRLTKLVGSSNRIDYLGRPVTLEFPSIHMDSRSFRDSYFAYHLVRKIEVVEDEELLLLNSLSSFLDADRACNQLNSGTALADRLCGDSNKILRQAFLRASQICLDVLGDAPPKYWFREACFTGGASTSRSRPDAHPALKWWARPSLEITPLALRHFCAFQEDLGQLGWVWQNTPLLECTPDSQSTFVKVVPGSRLDFVNKNYRVKRPVLIEPDGNMLLQKAVGNVVRRLLLRFGVDLNDQTLNQRLAKEGSLTGTLATLDLSAASDSISLGFARALLPQKWYELLYELRSPICKLPDGTWMTMRKLSSMGNGFTFEIESLLFYCLTQAVVDVVRPAEKRVGIYGDDIIVASSVAKLLTRLLGVCGFELNKEKSFSVGPFRESCGKHYHNGVDVTPVHIKGDLSLLEEKFRLANQLYAWEGHFGPLTNTVVETIPVSDRRLIPPSYDDTQGLKTPECCHPIRVKRGKRGLHTFCFSVYAPKRTVFDRFSDECRWFYGIMGGWAPTQVGLTSITEYTPLTLVREGGREWVSVKVPAVTAVMP